MLESHARETNIKTNFHTGEERSEDFIRNQRRDQIYNMETCTDTVRKKYVQTDRHRDIRSARQTDRD